MLLSSALALELSAPAGTTAQPLGSGSSLEALLPPDGKVALIVPAFDINAAIARDHFEMAEIADRAVLFTKQEMVQAFKSNVSGQGLSAAILSVNPCMHNVAACSQHCLASDV